MTTNYYQLWLFPFLSVRKRHLPQGIQRRFYHSFEDGLWHLLQNRLIPKQSVILVPNFYCMDVVNNIRIHGYRPVFYPLDRHFQIKLSIMMRIIRRTKPRVIILFHAAGISSKLLNHPLWMKRIKETLFIEDCVHRIIDPENVRLYNANHYILDSLRKVTPLPGSFLYGNTKEMPSATTHITINRYYLLSSAYFFLFRFVYIMGMLTRLPSVVRYAHEVILKRHDDIIGDSIMPTRGIPWPTLFADHIDPTRIQACKKHQVLLYRKGLYGLSKIIFYPVHIRHADYGNLHAYPLGIRGKPRQRLIRYLHQRGIIVWYKFSDSLWSKRRSVIFLPLGFHVSDVVISSITTQLRQWYTK